MNWAPACVCACVRICGGGRGERERETDTDREIQKQRETKVERDKRSRKKQRDRQADRREYKARDRQAAREIDNETEKERDRETQRTCLVTYFVKQIPPKRAMPLVPCDRYYLLFQSKPTIEFFPKQLFSDIIRSCQKFYYNSHSRNDNHYQIFHGRSEITRSINKNKPVA